MNNPPYIDPPETEQELLSRTAILAGMTLSQIAQQVNLSVPDDLSRHKGWAGKLAEIYLGATAANLSEPDFQSIGIELKTIPMATPGVPKESTYICTVNLTETSGINWQSCAVRKKLARVLWLPIESSKAIPLQHRRFGSAFLWSPDAEQERILRNDWEEIMELICIGDLDKVSASLGRYLQIRPKAANANSLGRSYSKEGIMTATLPRGFYLRSSFTRTLFKSDEN